MKRENILFVCLGNICRSPAAEGIFREMVHKKGVDNSFNIDSAGTYSGHNGELPDRRMREAASTRGLNLTHRSRLITTDDFDNFDMIVVMDDNNYEKVCRIAPTKESIEKIYRMAQFSSDKQVTHIPDPYYMGREGFDMVLDILDDCCENLLKHLRKTVKE